MLVQLPSHRSLYLQSGTLYPARRYLYGMSKAISSLDFLVNGYKPEISPKTWTIPKGKVVTRDPKFWANHKYGPILVAEKDDWKLDSIIDYYTESSRVATPGYGEDYSPSDLWHGVSNTNDRMSQLLTKAVQTPEQAREAMYLGDKKRGVAGIAEARLANVTSSKGLYEYLSGFVKNVDNRRVLDISAFGDRMVGAVANGLIYTGIDPDNSLVEGMSRLRMDLSRVSQMSVELFTLPMEGYWPSEKLDIITLSPPPYNMERYSGGERQTHKVYKDFPGWFNGFIRETLTRCHEWLKPGGILAFTVLDRPGDSKNPELPTITYTEAMVILTEDLGFEFIEIFGLPSTAPWWVFRRSERTADNLSKYYPELMPTTPVNTPLLEYIRRCLQKYIIGVLQSVPGFDQYQQEHMDTFLGRLVMNGNLGSSDVVFPDSIGDSIKGPIVSDLYDLRLTDISAVLQTADPGFYIQASGSNAQSLALNLYRCAVRYLQWIVTTTAYDIASSRLEFYLDSDDTIALALEKRHSLSVIGFIRRYVPFGPEGISVKDFEGPVLVLWKTMRKYDESRFTGDDGVLRQGLSDLRYDTVGAYGHHFTRPQKRMALMEKITGELLIDLFATPFNTNTESFASPYPDVDSVAGSVGSFFNIDWDKLTKTTSSFMANPPDFPGFIENVMSDISDVLNNYKCTFFIGTVLKDATDGKYLDAIRAGNDPAFENIDNAILKYCWTQIKPEFLKCVYILDKQKYPSLNPMTGKTSIREGSESVGVVLSSKSKWTSDEDDVKELGTVVFFD